MVRRVLVMLMSNEQELGKEMDCLVADEIFDLLPGSLAHGVPASINSRCELTNERSDDDISF